MTSTHPAYVEQVRSYARLLHAGRSDVQMRGALLFTATGRLEWVTQAPGLREGNTDQSS